MYTVRPSRANPTCFLFLLDQSGSMANSFGTDGNVRKADFVADVVNRTLHDLIIRCTKTTEIRNYYHVAVIGYGGVVSPAFSGYLAAQKMFPISQVAEYPVRVEKRHKKILDGAGGIVEQPVKFPVWVEPQAEGKTPMCSALAQAKVLLQEWVASHASGFPPTVLHLTDGESTDGDPTPLGREIMSLRTDDGPVLLFNCHVSSLPARPLLYPSDSSSLTDVFGRALYSISSPFPEAFLGVAPQMGLHLGEGARGFIFNADPASLAQSIEIGTSTTPAAPQPYSWM